MASSPHLTDQQRDELEAALILAITQIYQHRQSQAFAKLGAVEKGLHLSPGAMVRINAKAHEIAASVQKGVNNRLQQAQDQAEQDGSDPAAAVQQAKVGMHRYNAKTLVPYLVSWAKTQGTVDAYHQMPGKAQGISLRDSIPWRWVRGSGCTFPDPCGDAEAASPASYDDLVSTAGGECPIHRNCQCSLEPAS